ncbi:MAG: flavin reductase family protein [Candidatus Heimdallarchaeota archaeon]|nr:MAG: flavin reductase family protein [Candidatus Heimdallarchaeota archaeon]
MTKKEITIQQGIMAFPGFPIVLVCVKDNIITVAAVSFFSFGDRQENPPMVMVGIVPTRYTYELLKETDDYSINIPTIELLEAIKICGSKSGWEVNKFEAANLTPKTAKKISSYLIEECPVNLECKVVHKVELQGSSHTWFIGEIVAAYQQDSYDRSQAILYWPREYRFIGEVIKK